ncbi:MAG: carbon starvation protein A [Deltaproteobacteria bacterium]|jgi:carbon starvation protein|nr:carbon starvation protein A [Deltaproteobacteria bacterium]
MTSVALLICGLILFSLAYKFYSPYIGKILGVKNNRPTPAHTMRDDIDYCPAKGPVLFGHHFASIAGAAPIVGPVVAAAYGWGPVAIWIILGGIFLGSVHDFSSLVASVHHNGQSIGKVIEEYVGSVGKHLFLFFLWMTLVLVIAVFLVVTAKTFVAVPAAATASVLFILLAVVFGIFLYKLKLPLGWLSLIGIVFLIICMIIGWNYPIAISLDNWITVLVVYIFIASVAPVWILLQPRDYLNSFLLYALLISATVGIFFARPSVELPVFTAWVVPKLGPLFPILFVTVACGAISGFHSVVASGTTAKQLNKESNARPIGYGAMLVESLLALIALISVMYMAKGDYVAALLKEGPITLFSQGIGNFISSFGISASHGTKFAALAVSAFVLTSLDTATRLARFAFQEFFAPKEGRAPSILNKNRFIGTAITVAAGAALAYSGQWKAIWPIFGSANQLLAALALLAISLWLRKKGSKSKVLQIPMIIMFVITLSALGLLVWQDIHAGKYVLTVIGSALFILALVLVFEAIKSIRRSA